jgi:hypothetical protein
MGSPARALVQTNVRFHNLSAKAFNYARAIVSSISSENSNRNLEAKMRLINLAAALLSIAAISALSLAPVLTAHADAPACDNSLPAPGDVIEPQ